MILLVIPLLWFSAWISFWQWWLVYNRPGFLIGVGLFAATGVVTGEIFLAWKRRNTPKPNPLPFWGDLKRGVLCGVGGFASGVVGGFLGLSACLWGQVWSTVFNCGAFAGGFALFIWQQIYYYTQRMAP